MLFFASHFSLSGFSHSPFIGLVGPDYEFVEICLAHFTKSVTLAPGGRGEESGVTGHIASLFENTSHSPRIDAYLYRNLTAEAASLLIPTTDKKPIIFTASSPIAPSLQKKIQLHQGMLIHCHLHSIENKQFYLNALSSLYQINLAEETREGLIALLPQQAGEIKNAMHQLQWRDQPAEEVGLEIFDLLPNQWPFAVEKLAHAVLGKDLEKWPPISEQQADFNLIFLLRALKFQMESMLQIHFLRSQARKEAPSSPASRLARQYIHLWPVVDILLFIVFLHTVERNYKSGKEKVFLPQLIPFFQK